jgi:hypothetical protein
LCRFCRRVQRVNQEPRGGWPAALGPRGVGIDPAQPAMLLEQAEGRVEVGGLGKAPPRRTSVGVAASELHLAGAADPVQQPAGIIDAGIGAHQVEHRPSMVDQVAGQTSGAGEGVGVDRLGPAVAEVASQVQEAGEAAGAPASLAAHPAR